MGVSWGSRFSILPWQTRARPGFLYFSSDAHPDLDLAHSPFFVNTAFRPWQGEQPLRAGVSAFGLGGTNAHLILEEPPRRPVAPSARAAHLVLLSAHSRTALEQATERLLGQLRAQPETSLADLAFTLQVGRQAHPYRRCLVVERLDQLAALRGAAIRQLADGAGAQLALSFQAPAADLAAAATALYAHEPGFLRRLPNLMISASVISVTMVASLLFKPLISNMLANQIASSGTPSRFWFNTQKLVVGCRVCWQMLKMR